jgi:hypothetical protein
MQTIPPKVWESVRADYVSGEGSLAVLAARHGLKISATEKRCKAEGWTALRKQRADGALARLVPPPDISLPPPQLPPATPLSPEWVQAEQLCHFRENALLIREGRKKISEFLASAPKLDERALSQIAAAISTLSESSARLLGINSKEKRLPKRRANIVPLDVDPIAPTVDNENNAAAG